jgi:molybdopterin-guanine dinucleotide biosynthesis protein A
VLSAEDVIVGVFTGGASRRMGSPKGLLLAPDGSGRSLVARLWDVAGSALPGAERVLVGRRAEYAHLGLPTLDDARAGSGPLGGLVALLRYGEARGRRAVVALACDLPYLEERVVSRLLAAPEAQAVAALEAGRYQPLVARYATSLAGLFAAALDEQRLSLQPLLEAVRAAPLLLEPGEERALLDWDAPGDVTR